MLINENLIKYEREQQRQEALEHRDVLLAIGAIIKRPEGVKLFRYLFKNFNVADLPDSDMEGKILHEFLGFLKAGKSIFEVACEADSTIAASILSNIKRENYDKLREQQRLEQDTYGTE